MVKTVFRYSNESKPERLDFCLVLLGQSGVIRNSLFMHWILLDHDRDQSTPSQHPPTSPQLPSPKQPSSPPQLSSPPPQHPPKQHSSPTPKMQSKQPSSLPRFHSYPPWLTTYPLERPPYPPERRFLSSSLLLPPYRPLLTFQLSPFCYRNQNIVVFALIFICMCMYPY